MVYSHNRDPQQGYGMETKFLSIDRGEVNYRKMMLFLIVIELATVAVFLTNDIFTIAMFGVILVAPILLILIPVEPVLTIPFLFIATGLHFFALITKREGTWYNLTYFHIAAFLTLLSVLGNMMVKRKKTIPSSTLYAPFITFLVIIAVSLIYTPNFIDGFMELARLVVLFAIALAMIISIDSKWKVKFTMVSYVIIPLLVSLYTVYDIMTGGEFYKSQVIKVATELGIHVYRSTGTFYNPNDLAAFLMVGIMVSFGLLFVKEMRISLKVILFVFLIISSAGLIASFSRGAWLATFFGCFFLMAVHRKWSYFALFFGIFAIMFLIMSLRYPEIVLAAFGRFATLFNPSEEASSSTRISLIKTGISIWKESPLFGVGAGGHSYYSIDFMDPDMPRAEVDVVLPHTLQMKILVEEGLVGLTVAMWFVVTVFVDGMRAVKKIKDDFLRNAEITLLSLYMAFLVFFTFNSDMFSNIFWLSIGVMYAIPLVYEKSLKSEQLSSVSS